MVALGGLKKIASPCRFRIEQALDQSRSAVVLTFALGTFAIRGYFEQKAVADAAKVESAESAHQQRALGIAAVAGQRWRQPASIPITLQRTHFSSISANFACCFDGRRGLSKNTEQLFSLFGFANLALIGQRFMFFNTGNGL